MNWHARALIPNVSNPTPARPALASGRALSLPLACALSLLAFVLFPPVQQNPRLFWSCFAAGAALISWVIALRLLVPSQRGFAFDVELRSQHYVQACAHASILVYWGWYWRPVYDYAYLIAAQLLFAYAFDALLTWSRGQRFTLGFGPFPIVFSTNLFLWFRPDWFFLQFAMLAVGFTAKALIRWDRNGRRAHIFNPSALSLTVFSIALLVTGTSSITWGQDIAVTQFFPPHMYAFLFLVALPGQLLFGVTTMTMSAVVTTYAVGLAYAALTGTYYFFDSYIPIAVFLGMHLLFTDPSTAPRTEGGRMIFGALYGLSTVGLYAWLGASGLPTFYDKLLQVPLMNLSVKAIDWAMRSTPLALVDPARAWRGLTGRPRNVAYVALWTAVFLVMSAVQGVGDSHPGQWLPFWQHACSEGRPGACRHLSQMYATYCRAGSSWSCGELANGSQPAQGPPPIEDLPVVLRGSKGPITDRDPSTLRARACAQGWAEMCGQ